MHLYTTIYRLKGAGNYYLEGQILPFILAGYQEEEFEEEEIELEVGFDGEWVDEGIGGTEYWGGYSTHHDWCYEVEELDSAVDTQDGRDWLDHLTEEERDRIKRECEEEGRQEDDG